MDRTDQSQAFNSTVFHRTREEDWDVKQSEEIGQLSYQILVAIALECRENIRFQYLSGFCSTMRLEHERN
jgi:hypothetical protein